MRGLFVTGTDTGAGKSILTASLLAAMSAAGEPVVAHKPAVTGLDEPPGAAGWPADHELLALAAGMDPLAVSPLLFGPAVSPHLAARARRGAGQRRELCRCRAGEVTAAARWSSRVSAACWCRSPMTSPSATWPSRSACRS